VEVQFVDNSGDFYVHLENDTSTMLDPFMELLTEHYSTMGSDDAMSSGRMLVEGDVCAALYSKDCAWYRAVVESDVETGARLVNVRFVDYGNSETCDASAIKELLPRFLTLPAQALRCHLHGFKVGPLLSCF